MRLKALVMLAKTFRLVPEPPLPPPRKNALDMLKSVVTALGASSLPRLTPGGRSVARVSRLSSRPVEIVQRRPLFALTTVVRKRPRGNRALAVTSR